MVLGFNGLTLKVLGKVRYVVIINFVAVCLNILLNLLLIPRYGALGAGIATASSMIIHNILKQMGLQLASGISVFDGRLCSIYVFVVLCATVLFLFQFFVSTSLYWGGVLICLFSILVLKLFAKRLDIEETFPELIKLPFMRYFLAAKNF